MNPPALSLRERKDALEQLGRVERDFRRAGAGRLRQLHIALGRPPIKRLGTGIGEARAGLERHGRGVREVHGVSLPGQAASLWGLHVRHRFSSEEYYLYQLYLRDRRRVAERFIPRRRTLSLLSRLHGLTGADLGALRDKRRCTRCLEEAGLPTPPILAVVENGRLSNGLPEHDLFAKPAAMLGGLGAMAWSFAGDAMYLDVEGRSWTAREVEVELQERSRAGPIVLQERLSNHASLAPLSSGALCCARLVTCRRPDGGFDCLPATFRLAWGSAVVDNFARGGFKVPVDLETGEITGPGVALDDRCGVRSTERHPDTQAAFVGFRLPWWEEAVDLALRGAAAFPEIPFVGWDVAFLDEGPVLIEGNADWNADGIQLPHGLGLGDTQFVVYYLHHLREAQVSGRASGTPRSEPSRTHSRAGS
jgi:hypothetical protein